MRSLCWWSGLDSYGEKNEEGMEYEGNVGENQEEEEEQDVQEKEEIYRG